MGASVRRKGIDQHSRHGRIGKTKGQCQLHHTSSITFPKIAGFPDPDINYSKASGHATPIMAFCTGKIDDLDKSDRTVT